MSYYDPEHLESLADAEDKALRDDLWPSVKQQARDELVSECHKPGSEAQLAWAAFNEECNPVNALDFVRLSAETNDQIWADRCEVIWDDIYDGMTAS